MHRVTDFILSLLNKLGPKVKAFFLDLHIRAIQRLEEKADAGIEKAEQELAEADDRVAAFTHNVRTDAETRYAIALAKYQRAITEAEQFAKAHGL